MKNTQNTPSTNKNIATVAVLAVASITTSFAIGMQTSGDIKPFTLIEAGGNAIAGDTNNDAIVNKEDVILMLEMVAGYTPVTPEAYEADPNHDGRITIDDVLSVLHDM